jgi:hypothetical protein
VLLFAVNSIVFAQPESIGMGPMTDWWARVISVAAILISLAAFFAGRWDKWRERKAAAAAKLPLVDVQAETSETPGQWFFTIATTNRANVSIQLISVEVGSKFELKSTDSKPRPSGRPNKLVIDRLRIGPASDEIIDGDIYALYPRVRRIIFVLEYRIYEATPRTIFMKIRRDLEGWDLRRVVKPPSGL